MPRNFDMKKKSKKVIKFKFIKSIRKRIDGFLARRPHRSFRRTRRRDYTRSFAMPGFFAFSKYVRRTLWANRKIFLLLALTYTTLTAIISGIASQDAYNTLSETLQSTSGEVLKGGWGAIGKSVLLFTNTMMGGISVDLSAAQQIGAVLVSLLIWLSTIWLLRNILAGHKVKLRDGLYSSGAPILPTFLVALLLLVQLLPLAIAIFGYSAAASTGLLSGGIEAMLFWAAAGSLVVLSLYFFISTFFAMIIVTLPGMYPAIAIKTAGDMVIGRRFRILMRLIWLFASVALSWAVIMIPIILIDAWAKGMWSAINWLPVVPVSILLMSSITIVYSAAYVYLLYRKVVDDGADPA